MDWDLIAILIIILLMIGVVAWAIAWAIVNKPEISCQECKECPDPTVINEVADQAKQIIRAVGWIYVLFFILGDKGDNMKVLIFFTLIAAFVVIMALYIGGGGVIPWMG